MKAKILKYLGEHPAGSTPTTIGMALGKPYNSASSSVSQPLKTLISEGVVERIKINNKVIYKKILKK